MTVSEVRPFPGRGELATDVAAALLERIAAVQARGEVPHIGLTGGSIAEEIHAAIARLSGDSDVDWSRVVLWWGDERWLPSGSEDRNEVQAHRDFIDAVGVDPDNVHVMPPSDAGLSLSEAADAYSSAIADCIDE